MLRLATVQLAVRSLLLHKLRSFLTMLGTILGVGSVIAMLAIGEGSRREAVERIRELGATNVIVRSVKPQLDQGPQQAQTAELGTVSTSESSWLLEFGLTYADLDLLRATLPTVERVVPITILRKPARAGRRRLQSARILGVTAEYAEVKNLEVKRGRFIAGADLATSANVVVLAHGAASRLFGYEDPLDQSLLLGEGAYRVVGVLAPQGSGRASPGAASPDDQNEDLYVPLSSARARFGEVQVIRRSGSLERQKTELAEITLTVFDESQVRPTASMARRLLEKSHPRQDDFRVEVPLELLEQAEREKRLWNLVLGSIAGISLLVGGIGIMNIMLATVTERTREIGIRRALGARQRDIVVQFLVETLVLSTSGGLLGIAFGLLAPLALAWILEVEVAPSIDAVVLAFSLSVGVGVVFGIYPARRAAALDPIEALRHQ